MKNCWTRNIFEIQERTVHAEGLDVDCEGEREWKMDDSKIFHLSSYRMGVKDQEFMHESDVLTLRHLLGIQVETVSTTWVHKVGESTGLEMPLWEQQNLELWDWLGSPGSE